MKTYRLTSVPLVNTPGLLAYAAHGYKTSRGRGRTPFINIFAQGYNLDRKVVVGLLSGKIPHEVEGDTVVFSVEG